MDAAAKQQIVERIRQANNILVTVSNNPTVDQLAACIGLTLLLNRMEKHATAVFSGRVPSTLEFLQPEKTIETNTDSLRDFIISLDKEKADKLRYKVEDQFVRIFITPYKTSLSEKDLVFGQGDYNVEVVIALGIKKQTEIDAAITAHGKILHDATVISLNVGQGSAPQLGQINWQEPTASSLCEMLVSISESFGQGLIDNQTATAFLTGIVAETARFSNPKTSPKVMTMSAQLMAAGANQQLIVSKLEPPVAAISVKPKEAPKMPVSGTLTVAHEEPKDEAKPQPKVQAQPVQTPKSPATPQAVNNGEILIDEQGNLVIPSAGKPATEVSPHTFLNPDDQSSTDGTPFTANAKPEWDDPFNTVSIDPLSSGGPPAPTVPNQVKRIEEPASEQGKNVAPPNVDKARSAVENALAAAPFDPAVSPPAVALSTPSSDLGGGSITQPPASTPLDAAASAPPFPPPLTPKKGVVIPSNPSITNST